MATALHECWVCGLSSRKMEQHDGHDICLHCKQEVVRLAEGLLRRAVAHMRHRRLMLAAVERRKTATGAA